MKGDGRVCLAGARWCGWGGGEAGGYRQQQSAASAKGPPVCVGLATPSAGPRSIQTQSNKAFPLSSPQNTKQSGEGRGGRQGEEGVRDGVVRREGSCSASHTNFLTPLFTSLFFFFSPPFPTLTTNHLTLHLSFTSQYPVFSFSFFSFSFFSSSSLPILLVGLSQSEQTDKLPVFYN